MTRGWRRLGRVGEEGWEQVGGHVRIGVGEKGSGFRDDGGPGGLGWGLEGEGGLYLPPVAVGVEGGGGLLADQQYN